MKKKLVAFIMAIIILIQVMPVNAVTILPDEHVEISSVVVENVSVFEGTSGWYTQDWDYEEQKFSEYYFYYNFAPKQITVTYSDGSVRTDSFDNWGAEGAYFAQWPEDRCNQSYENQWTAGSKHSMVLSMNNIETTYNFEILPTIVESISVDGNTQIESEYGIYTYPLGGITIAYKNGEVATFDSVWDVENQTGYNVNFYGDTGDWKPGEHIMYAAYMGVIAPYTITVIENPIEKIEIAPITIIEGTNIATRYEWIDDQEINYPAYYYFINDYTIFYKNGESQHITDGSEAKICGNSYGFTKTDDQSIINKWGLGKHTAHAVLGGLAETDFEVNIIDSPVKSVSVNALEMMEGYNCWSCDEYDEYGGFVGTYNKYYIEPNEITIEYSDGTSYTGSIWELQNQLGIEIIVDSDQSYNNQWGAGTHSATITVAGKTFSYNVIINPSPVKSIVVDDVIIYENNEGYYTNGFNPETGNWDAKYYQYNIPNYHYTVTLNDGSVLSNWAADPVKINGNYYNPIITTNQSYENKWGVGEHTATATLLGKSVNFKVTVLPCPIKKLSVDKIIRYKNADGYMSGEWVWDETTGTGKEINCYFKYDWDMEYTATAELYDGTIVTSNYNDYPHTGARGGAPHSFMINGVICRIGFEDDQSYDNQWDIGEHTAKAICCGVTCDFTVEIVSSPIKSVLVDKITLIEGIDGYWEGDNFVYTLPEDLPFTAILQDGTELTAVKEYKYNPYCIYINNTGYYIQFESETIGRDWVAGKTYEIPTSICGFDFSIEVEIIENPYVSLSIEDCGDLYLLLTRKDGTVERQKVIGFDTRAAGDVGEHIGILTTDKHQFPHAIFRFDRPSDMFEKHIGYYLQCTDNINLEIGGLTSNTLEKSNWLSLQLSYAAIPQKIQLYRWYTKQEEKAFNGYNGNVTDENIDDVVTIAVNICDYFGAGDIGEDGYDYGVFDVDSVKKDVELLFGIKDIDLTKFSGYNASTKKVYVLYLTGGSGPITTVLKYENEKWNIEYTDAETEDFMRIVLNKDTKIESIAFTDDACTHDNTEIRNAKSPTCCEDGYTGDTYCIDCKTKIESGSVIPATGNHTDADGKWETDGTSHWHTCYHGTTFDEAEHSGGTATCKQKAVCEDCGVEYGDYAKHKLTKHKRLEPTVDNDGNIEYWTCDECGKYFSDEEGNYEICADDTVIGKLTIKKLTYLDGEVLIEVPSNAVPEDFEITVDKIVPPPAEIVEKVKDTYGESSEVLAYYEIRLFDENGDRIYKLDSEITIKSILPEKYQTGYIIKISQEDDDGNLVEMESWREGEYICYNTDWLEKY